MIYNNDIEDCAAEAVEEFTGTDISGKTCEFIRSGSSEQYEAELDSWEYE